MKGWFLAATLATTTASGISAQTPGTVIVEAVVSGSAANTAGIAAQDRILSYDGHAVPSPAALQALEEHAFTPSRVAVGVQRGADTHVVSVPRGALGIRVRPLLSSDVLPLYEHGRRAQVVKDTATAVARWSAAAALAREGGNDDASAWLYALVGELQQGERRWKDATAAYEAAWALLKQTSDRAAQSRTLTALGQCHEQASDFEPALEFYARALRLDTAAGHDVWIAADLTNLGVVSHARGDLDAGQQYHTRALAIRELVAPGSLDVAASLNNLGNSYFRRGDFLTAEHYYNRALEIRTRLAPNSLLLAGVLNNLGNIANNRADLAAAEDYYSRALAILERDAPDSLLVTTILSNLGNLARVRGDLETAGQLHGRVLAIRERLAPDSLRLASTLNNLGLVAWTRGEHSTSRAYHARALAIRERLAPDSLLVAESLDSLGDVARSLGDRGSARAYYDRAIAIQERLSPDSLKLAENVDKLGGLAIDEGRSAEALAYFTRAVNIVEAQRARTGSTDARALLLARHYDPYAGLLQAQVALGDVSSAFATAERLHARGLLDILGEGRGEIRQGVDQALLKAERDLQREINSKATPPDTRFASGEAARREDLDTLLVRYRDLQSRIRATSPRYAALTQPQPLGLNEVQRQVLDEGTLLLEYVLGEPRSHLFAVTTSRVMHYQLPGRVEIERAARRVHDALTARQSLRGDTPVRRRARIEKADADYPEAAAALSRMVLGPAAGQLAGQRLLIVADRALQYVAFAALPHPGRLEKRDAEPLVTEHEIVTAPSASVVALLRREQVARKPMRREVAVIADPVFDAGDPRLKRQRQSAVLPAGSLPKDVTHAARAAGLADERGALARLPFSREEADAIAALAPAAAARAVDFKASRATLSSPQVRRADIVHLATHGILDTERPELSGIVLSLLDERGQPQDGFLRLHEVYNLDWSANLVVLSACQTALGQDIRGEGLVGLTRGFMYGGAARVMASLWSVNDSATARLMEQFYAGLLGNGLPPAEALRKAQVEMWRKPATRSPYYWAAFVLQGEWR